MMNSANMTMQRTSLARGVLPLPSTKRSSHFIARLGKDNEPKETSTGQDAYSKIEAPVRDTIPDGGKPVSERNWGQDDLNPDLKNDQLLKPFDSDISAADAMRFSSAIPEVANSRLAMIGVFAALIAEVKTGKNVFEQFQAAPIPIALVFFTLTLATAVPVFKGVPRKGNAVFSSDAELLNGRVAMIGFLGIVLSSFYFGSALWFL